MKRARIGAVHTEIEGLDDADVLSLIRAMGHRHLYITTFPPSWTEEQCEVFSRVIGDWITAQRIPPSP